MCRYIDNFACEDCQKDKLDGKGYGLLSMRDFKEQTFEEVAVDLIGPWKVQVRGKPYEFNALTAIDTVTNLIEIVRTAQDKSCTLQLMPASNRMPLVRRDSNSWMQAENPGKNHWTILGRYDCSLVS